MTRKLWENTLKPFPNFNDKNSGMPITVLEADYGLISKWQMRPVIMFPFLVPVCQHAAAAAMFRSQSGALWMFWAISCSYETSVGNADKDTVSSLFDQPLPDPGCWEKTLSPHDTERGTAFVWCGCLQYIPIAPGYDGCSHEHGQGLLDGILWHSSNYWHLPPWKPKTWEPNNIFNNYRPPDIV